MKKITVETSIDAPIETVWEYWSQPVHINKWYFASDDWEAPEAENDLREGGKFKTRMQAKDKSAGFDFSGSYTAVKELESVEYDLDDGRHVKVEFKQSSQGVKVTTTFDPEDTNPFDLQRQGWQAILDNFNKYVMSR